MYGELTEKEAVERVDRALDHHLADQFEILLYKKNRTYASAGRAAAPCAPYSPRALCRHAAVAAGARGAHPQRARAGGAVPAHVPRHHGAQAAHRRRRPQGRPVSAHSRSGSVVERRVTFMMWCARRAVEVREAGALSDAVALGAGVGAAGAQGAAAREPPGARQYCTTLTLALTLLYRLYRCTLYYFTLYATCSFYVFLES